jgi:hypothetical protein
MSSQTITATGTSGQSSVINSTKIRVTSNASPVLYAVGTSPIAGTGFANTEMIAPGTTRYINMQGLGNKIAFITPTGVTATLVTVTEIGTVYAVGQATNATYVTT